MKSLANAAILTVIAALAMTANAAELKEGDKAPDVAQKTHESKKLNVSKAAAEGYTLVYFYPKADTPGCTKQACSLRDAYEELTKKGVTVIGVSADTVEAQAAFKEKYKLPFTLLADKNGSVIDAFGVPKNPRGMASRQAYLFKDGTLVWRDLQASTEQQAADVLEVIKS